MFSFPFLNKFTLKLHYSISRNVIADTIILTEQLADRNESIQIINQENDEKALLI